MTRDEMLELYQDLEHCLSDYRKMDLHGTTNYTRLWRQVRRLEEKLNRHPY